MSPIIERNISFKIPDISEELYLIDFTAREAISSPYEVTLTFTSYQADSINVDDVIGKEAFLTVTGIKKDRYFHGIISQFVHAGHSGNRFHYRITIVPQLWLLSLVQDCRIFQKMDVKAIVTKILDEGGITADKFEFRLKGSYEKKEYCVQYRESNLNFISRLLEEEGIFYFFEHKEDQHFLVFADDIVHYKPIAGGDGNQTEVMFHHKETRSHERDTVQEFSLSRQIRTGKVTLNDFNFERPSLPLKFDKTADTFDALEMYDYPGEYTEETRGKNLAKIRLEEARAFMDKAEGKSDCPNFVSGFTFKLGNHELETFNKEFLVVEVIHVGTQSQTGEGGAGTGSFSYSNQFVGIPSSVVMRPERITPKPIMEGVQTAIVVGMKGEEIYTDEEGHGMVKVQFHWDRLGKKNEKSSCWIRVSQVWAGAGWGAMHIPRIDQEVIVDFEEGDPDRPIITGRVYHGTNKPPYTLPDDKTKSVIRSETSLGGGSNNELLMEDKSGETQVVLSNAYGHKIIQDEKTQTTTIKTRDENTVCMDDKNKNISIETTNKHKLLFDDENKKIVLSSTDGHSMEIDDENKKITTKTTNGHIFVFDDENKKIELTTTDGHSTILDDDNKKISIHTASGHHVTLDDDNDNVTIEDAGGNIVKLDGGSTIEIESGGDINIKAPSGAISLEASEISIKSDGKIDVEAGGDLKMKGMNLEAKGDMDAKLEGGMNAGVKGGIMTKVEGTIVMIN